MGVMDGWTSHDERILYALEHPSDMHDEMLADWHISRKRAKMLIHEPSHERRSQFQRLYYLAPPGKAGYDVEQQP